MHFLLKYITESYNFCFVLEIQIIIDDIYDINDLGNIEKLFRFNTFLYKEKVKLYPLILESTKFIFRW